MKPLRPLPGRRFVSPVRRLASLTLLLLPPLLAPPWFAAGASAASAFAAGSFAAEPADARPPGTGALLWKSARGLVPLPVVGMEIDLAVTGIMVRGNVVQTFRNPTPEVIEAIYVFPLPEGAAVDAMEMRIGERRVRAVLREREEAKAVYEEAKQEGKKAGLVDQERPNLFTTSVANINPGEEIQVRLRYLEEVACRDGEFGLVFPLTFTPRYAPAAGGGAGRGRGIEARFVRPESPAAPRASLEVHIDSGLPLEEVRSPSHPIQREADGSGWRVRPEGGPVVADRDFILRWRVRRDDGPAGTLFVEDREEERYGLLMLAPPRPESAGGRGLPTETLFVIDVSGSMDGPSIEQAREALLRTIDRLRPGDAFDILKFNDRYEALSERFLPAREAELEAARAWVRALRADGGTEITAALVRGMRMLAEADPWPARRLVLITDGAVDNEEEVLAEVTRLLGEARLHIIGIGSSPNRSLVRRLAGFGRGTWEFIGSVEEIGERTDAFLARIDRPVMTGLALRWEGDAVPEAYPRRLPDLYAGEPLFVSFRLDRQPVPARAVLSGETAGGPVRIELEIAAEAERDSGVATRWARAKVEELMDGLPRGVDEAAVRREVLAVALGFNLVTRYTSLVAVEDFPSADASWTTHRVAGSLPHGSAPIDGVLPQGGTSAPLLAIVGLALALAGAFATWLGRREA